MSDMRLSDLNPAGPITGTEELYLVQGGQSVRAPVSALPTGGGGTVEIPHRDLGSTSSLVIDMDGQPEVTANATLTGNATLTVTNAPSGRLALVTLHVAQDASGGHSLTLPPGTTLLNGSDGSPDPAPGATTILTLLGYAGEWLVALSDGRGFSLAIEDVAGLNTALNARPTGQGVTHIRALTQAQYDDLTPDPTTLYVITP